MQDVLGVPSTGAGVGTVSSGWVRIHPRDPLNLTRVGGRPKETGVRPTRPAPGRVPLGLEVGESPETSPPLMTRGRQGPPEGPVRPHTRAEESASDVHHGRQGWEDNKGFQDSHF